MLIVIYLYCKLYGMLIIR